MANAQTAHSIQLRAETKREHDQRVKQEGARVQASLLDDDYPYATLMKELIKEHGNSGKAVRFLLQFYQNNK